MDGNSLITAMFVKSESAGKKDLKNCGYCGDYPCHKLHFVFSNAPEAKKRLDKMDFSLKG
jgi:hypothetical protein